MSKPPTYRKSFTFTTPKGDEVTVELAFNEQEIAEKAGNRARRNKMGTSRLLGGRLVARVTRIIGPGGSR